MIKLLFTWHRSCHRHVRLLPILVGLLVINPALTIAQLINCLPLAPIVNGTVTNVSCTGAHNGSITANPVLGLPPYVYTWSTGATTQTINNLGPGTYSVTVANGICNTFGIELVANGGFELGNIGFSSSYTFCATSNCLQPEGRYAIGNALFGQNASYYHNNFGGGPYMGNRFLIVNGVGTPNTSVWCQTINVNPNSNYNFSTFVSSVNPASPALLQFSINGVNLGNVFQAPATVGQWANFFATWNSGSATTANICIVNQNTTATGNDFGLDNISFMECVTCGTTTTFTVTEPTPLNITTGTVNNVTCNGAANGNATVSASGGTTPYTYTWSNGQTGATASNLAPNTYTVTVTDARGCTANTTITITQPSVLNAMAIATSSYNGQNISCNGSSTGNITVNPSGGTLPYTYLWSNGATTQSQSNLPAGIYNVTVTDARGCTRTASVTLTNPPILTSTTSITSQITCFGASNGNITVSPAGGVMPYTYLWSNGATTQNVNGVSAGTYTVVITDANGCTANNSITVNQPTLLGSSASVTSNYNGQNMSCAPGNGNSGNANITVNPTGGTTSYTYLWSGGQTTQTVNGVGAGTYTVIVTDNRGCTSNASVTVTTPPPLTTNTNVTSNYNGFGISCFGAANGTATTTPTGGTSPYTYSWSNGQTSQTATGLSAGTYTVSITDANGCTVTSSVTLTQPAVALSAVASVTSNYNGQHVSCNGGTNGSITVNATGGTAPYAYAWSNGATTQSVNNVGAGTYNVIITDANGCTTTTSVTVNQPMLVTSSATVTSNYNGQNISCNSASGQALNGTIAASANGGTSPYTYVWSNGATTQTVNNIGAGTYTVTSTDANGCISTASVTVVEPPVLTSTSSVSSNYNGEDVSCNGSTDGTITVSPNGGTPAYTYLWSTGAITQTVNNVGAGTYTVTVTDANGCFITSSVTVTEPALPLTSTADVVSDYNGQDVSCNSNGSGSADGIISATPNGGTAPYTYLWSNGATTQTVNNVAAGTYTVTVSDVNGCTATASVTVTEPPVLETNTSVTSDYNGQNISCNGASDGSATATVNGGTAPYIYSWSNGATTQSINNLSAGTYTVTVTDANGCFITSSVTVTEPALPLTSTADVISDYNGQDVSCNGNGSGNADGIITATPNGGTAPYTYLWSNGATTQTVNNVAAGTYTVTVTDVNGCATTASVTVTEPPILTSSSSVTSDYNGQNISCNGASDGSATATVNGGTAPYSYSWSNGAIAQSINNLSAGTYTVTVTDANGCFITSSVTVTEPALPLTSTADVVSDYNGQDVSCNSNGSGSADGIISVTPNGGTAPYTYLWSNGATTQTVTNVSAGTYTVTVTDMNGCSTTASVTVTEPPILETNTSVTSDYNGQDISCNGASDGSATATVNGGTAPYSYSWSNGVTTQSINNLSAGTYTVTVTDVNGCFITSSVTVTEPALPLTSTADVISDYNGQDVSCNSNGSGSADGIITATPNGGTAPYTYLWSNGATTQTVNNVAAGTYTVIVTDVNGCTITASVTVTEPPILTSSSTVTSDYNGQDVSCNGSTDGVITVSSNGGTPAYAYLWNTGATTQTVSNVGAGTYTVTVTDANGCFITSSVTVTEPALPLTLTADVISEYNGQDVSCNSNGSGSADGIISATPNGGTAPYTYLWSNGATTQTVNNVAAGTYTVTVTDVNGCSTSASITVSEPPVLTSSSSVTSNYNGQDVSCNGSTDGVITVLSNGGTPAYTYLWSTGAITQTVNNIGAGTYSVTVTDANGCFITSSVTVTEPALPLTSTADVVSDYNGQDVSCNSNGSGSADGIITATPNGGTFPYTYVWSNGATTQTVTNVAAGTYTVTVTDVNGCTTTASVTVTEPPILTSSSTVNSDYNGQDVSCNGSTDGVITVSSNGGTPNYSYLWNTGATTQTVNNVGAGTYTVTVTDANGCFITSSVTVTEPALPLTSTADVVSDYNGQDVSCNSNGSGSADGIISVTPNGGTAPYTYLWSNGATTQTVNNVGAGTYTVTVTDVNLCTTTASVTVTEPPILTSSSSVSSDYNGQNVSCNGSTDGVITVSSNGGTPAYAYLWNTGATTQMVSNVGAGTYTVTVTDANGCFITSSVTVTEPALPLTSTADVTSDYNGQDVSCNSSGSGSADGIITATPNGGTAPYTYLWSNGAMTQTVNNVAAGNYTVTVTDVNGCNTTASVTVMEPPILTSSSSVASNYNGVGVSCFGSADGTITVSPNGGTPTYSYLWNTGAITQTVNNVAAGTYSVTVTDANGCFISSTVIVTQPTQAVSADVVVTDVACFGGNNGNLSASGNGGVGNYSYQWTNGPATAAYATLTAGSYEVTVTDANGCSAIVSAVVAQPAAAISVTGTTTDVLCNGYNSGAVNITVTGGTTNYSYQWSNAAQTEDLINIPAGTYNLTVTDAHGCIYAGYSAVITQPSTAVSVDGLSTNVKCFNGSDASIDLNVSGGTGPYSYLWSNGQVTEDLQNIPAGSYLVTVTDANGCEHNTYSVDITAPASAINITGASTPVTCFGDANGAVSINVNGGEPAYAYQWSNGALTQNISDVPAGQYSVSVDDERGCTHVANFNVVAPPVLNLAADVTDNICYGRNDGAINLQVTGGEPAYTYAWSNGSSSPNLYNVIPGNYSVNVSDQNGCSESASFTIMGAQPIVISLDSIHQVFAGQSVELFADVSGGTGSYNFQWTPEDYLSCATCPLTLASPVSNTNYVVTVTDGNGCSVIDNAHVIVNQDIFIPSAFTPGGGFNDGLNDTWKPVVNYVKDCTFQIFDRWGEKIYSTLDHNQGWDGTMRGKPVKVDVYVYSVYVVFMNGEEKTFRGKVTVIR